jgi:hypothetical protein
MKYLRLLFILPILVSCNTKEQKQVNTTTNARNEKIIDTESMKFEKFSEVVSEKVIEYESIEYTQRKFQVWELSTLSLKTCININSDILSILKNRSSFAYGLKFSTNYDSCKFIGWNESFTAKVNKINDRNFRVENGDYSYWDFIFSSENELYMREVHYKSESKTGFMLYKSVDSLKSCFVSIINRIAAELISGKYEPIYTDNFNCESLIVFDESKNVYGINEITRYTFNVGDPENPSDYDELSLYNKDNNKLKFSFKIVRDTLTIREIGEIYTDPDSGFNLRKKGKIRLRLLKRE